MALQMTWQQRSLQRRKAGPPLGLKNLGNTCYLNSVLQCLTYTPPFAQFCLASQHSSLCKSVFANRDKDCPFCILERQIARCLSLDGPLDVPSKIQKCLTLFAEHFRRGCQEDAHEFLRYVIDACHNTCLRLLKRLTATAGNALVAVEGSEEAAGGPSTVMKDIFGGALLSQVKCLACKGESNKTDEMMDISLDLVQINSLKDALARFFQPEVLDGNNKYSCGKCKKLSVARKQMFILRAPNVLIVQLKRFEGIHGGKINRNIEFEEVLVLSKFMYNATQDSQAEYNLFGSIVHSGFSPESGHYYAYIKDAFGHWYCCNDDHVSLSSPQEVLSEKVYILFYIRSNQIPRSSKTGSSCNVVKSLDSKGSDVLPSIKSADVLKPPVPKPNGVSSFKSNGSIMSKNGKISQSPQIKSFNLKNLEIKRATSNGSDSIETCNNVSARRDSATLECSFSTETKDVAKVEGTQKYAAAEKQAASRRLAEGRFPSKKKNAGGPNVPTSSNNASASKRSPKSRQQNNRFDTYTPLNLPREKILLEIKKEKYFQRPRPLKTSAKARDRSRYCRYHRDHGHNTEECFQLRDAIEDLIKRGYLGKYVNHAELKPKQLPF